MAEPSGQYTKLPPGWDCKFDQTTGNCYYINYFTKAMQLEDPRIRYKQLQNEKCSTESIPMQPLHGSPYHVYPTNNFPAMRAFQGPNPSLYNISASPLLSTKSQLQMEMSPVSHLKSSAPQTPRTGNMSRRSTIQETSFSSQIDTDAVVAKIQNMFPTAGENHIRLLLKKYYNREAVVISALQVEKHPVTMPGPFVTPPSQRHLFHSNSAFQMTPPARRPDIGAGSQSRMSRTASPIPGGRFGSVLSMHSSLGFAGHGSPKIGEIRNSPKPHSSPKMKLRYMKNIFPKADETLLLDILANSDNNVQKASETLIAMGYVKRDVAPPPKLTNRGEGKPVNMEGEECNKIIPLRPKVYTEEEKKQMKIRLQEKFNDIAERIISMALESVNYSEDRATQILQIVHDEDECRAKKEADALQCALEDDLCVDETQPGSSNLQVPTAISTSISNKSAQIDNLNLSSEQIIPVPIITLPTPSPTKTSTTTTTNDVENSNAKDNHRKNSKVHIKKSSPKESSEAEQDILHKQEFQSILGRIATMGHNTEYTKGPDDNLLLADYVTWNGANPDISLGRKNIAVGPDQAIIQDHSYLANGRNPDLCKGPQAGLAKGSIYSQLKSSTNTNIKCN
ncbi:uncharacterized protein LOC129944349 isoform X1 [Eupeodes corollae]|uniref:uncharacterized protein LOC129944349 isoform X1 n=1 Tax=Eupeodes corollae TaxID=290404 RepID=UPI0024928E6F|nr:uncharacterized protein LOC129944349 isoform X1 [Eupeodes corollae]